MTVPAAMLAADVPPVGERLWDEGFDQGLRAAARLRHPAAIVRAKGWSQIQNAAWYGLPGVRTWHDIRQVDRGAVLLGALPLAVLADARTLFATAAIAGFGDATLDWPERGVCVWCELPVLVGYEDEPGCPFVTCADHGTYCSTGCAAETCNLECQEG